LALVKEPREARVRNKAMPVFFEAYLEPGANGHVGNLSSSSGTGPEGSSSLEVGSFLPAEALLDLFPGDW